MRDEWLLQQFKKMNQAYRASAPTKADTEVAYTRFLRSIEQYDAATHESGSSQSLFFFVPQLARATIRGAAVVVVVVMLVVGTGAAMVSAFPNKLPGDFFYGVKLAAERAQVSLTFPAEGKARLELEFAGRRVEEMATIAGSSITNRDERLAEAVAKFRSHMEQTESQLKNAGRAQAVLDIAKTVDRKSVEYGAALERAGVEASGAIREDVRDAQDVAQSASIAAVTILLEEQREGRISLEELQRTVRAKLWELESALQVVAYRLATIPGDAYPEIEAVGGPTLVSLYQDVNTARGELEAGKDFFAHGGYDAALAHYRTGVGLLNHLTWATTMYDNVLAERKTAAVVTPEMDETESVE